MQALLAVIKTVLGWVRKAVGLVIPVFAEASDFRRWPAGLRVLVGLLVLAALAAGAYLLQRQMPRLNDQLTKVPRDVAPFFLPALVLLAVLFSWLLYGLWALLAADPAAAEFPDVDEAWAEVTRRLAAGGTHVSNVPLYLVLGRPAAGLDSLFLAAGVKDIVRTPAAGEPPLRAYAWADGIYVTCPGASAWGKACDAVGGYGEPDWGGQESSGGAAKTIGAGGFMSGADPIARAEMDELLKTSKERDLFPDEQERLRALAEQLSAAQPAAGASLRVPDDVIATEVRRLRFLCRLIARDRRPYCPVNGVLVLLPWAATETDESARAACGILQRDLSAARDVFRLRYPTYVAVVDVETARGFAEFRTGFPAEVLKQRIGQRLPLAPEVDPDKVPGVLAAAAQWIGIQVLPTWIVRFFRPERPDGSSPVQHNRNLYLLMKEVFARGPRLAQILARGLPPVPGPAGDPAAGMPLCGGCYLAGTGADAKSQAFVPGLFQRVADGQNQLLWSPEALAEDARLNRLTAAGYVAIVLLAGAAVAAGVSWWKAGG